MEKTRGFKNCKVNLSPMMVRFLQGTRPYIVEFVGTFILSLVICSSLMSPNWNWSATDDDAENKGQAVPSFVAPFAPIAIGCALMIMVYAGGHISGGHFNPAVSLAVFLSGRDQLSLINLIFYWCNQFFGGILAGIIAYGLFHNSPNVPYYEKHSTGRIFGAEFLGTLILILVVLQVGTSKKIEGNNFFGLAIGFTLIAVGTSIGQISGGVFNPAALSGLFVTCSLDNKAVTKASYAYFLAMMFASVIAPFFYFIMNIGDEYYVKEALAATEEKGTDAVDNIPDRRSTVPGTLSPISAAGEPDGAKV